MNRNILSLRKKRESVFVSKWQLNLVEAIHEDVHIYEKIPKRYYQTFMIMWNNFQDNLIGMEKDRLNELFIKLNMDKVAMNMLKSRHDEDRLLATLVLGNLKYEDAVDNLLISSKDNNIHLALASIHSLVKVDQERAIDPLVGFIKARDRYPVYKISRIIHDFNSEIVTAPLLRLIEEASREDKPKLMLLMQEADSYAAANMARNFLMTSSDSEIISASLKLLATFGEPKDKELIKKYLGDERSFVRMNAAKALGKVGNLSDLTYLEKLLVDFDWWVRLRSAEAIMALPGMTKEKIIKMRDTQIDSFAVDVLNHVLYVEGAV
jgi:hypothetical protein